MTFLLINQWKEKLQVQTRETSLSSAIPSEDTSLQAIITTDCSSETANTLVDHGQLISVPLSLLSVCLVQLFAVPLRHAEHEHPSFKTRLHAPAASRTRPEGMLSRVCTPTIASFIHFVPLFPFLLYGTAAQLAPALFLLFFQEVQVSLYPCNVFLS